MSPGITSSHASDPAPEPPTGADGETPGAPPGVSGERSRRERARRAARRAAAERRAFLAELTVALSTAADERAMVGAVARAVGARLAATRAGIYRVDAGAGVLEVDAAEYARPGTERFGPARVPLADLGALPDAFDGGRVLAVADAAAAMPPASYAAFCVPRAVRAFLGAPRVRDGRVVAVLYAVAAAPRAWSDNDVETVRAAAELLWGALDRAALRAELAAREAEFREMADNLPQLAWMADPSERSSGTTGAGTTTPGTTFDEMRGWGWRAVHHPDHLARVERRFRAAIEAGTPWEDTFPLRARSGGWRWFLSRANPIRGADGRVTRWFGTNTDLTEQLAAEEEREFLLELSAALQEELEPGRVAAVATERLRDRLGACARRSSPSTTRRGGRWSAATRSVRAAAPPATPSCTARCRSPASATGSPTRPPVRSCATTRAPIRAPPRPTPGSTRAAAPVPSPRRCSCATGA
jgi:PAS domain S-box-containing protein